MKTDPETTRRFLSDARGYAIRIMESSSDIRNHLLSQPMPDALREKLESLCLSLMGTKNDLIHEISEIEERMTTSPDSPEIAAILDRMHQLIYEAIQSFLNCAKEVFWAVEMRETDNQLLLRIGESWQKILHALPSPRQSGK